MEFIDVPSRAASCARPAPTSTSPTTGCASRASWSSASIATAPSEFTLHSWNPAHERARRRPLDGVRHRRPARRTTSTATASASTGDREGFQRPAEARADRSTSVHYIGGYPVEPVDLHGSIRHLEASYDILTLTDKGLHCYSLGRQRNRDCIEMVRIARGIDEATLDREPSVITVVNTNSPLRLDIPMAQGMIEFAPHNQPIVVTPFTLAGAMAPITLAGARRPAERRGARRHRVHADRQPRRPVMYGGFTSNVDMQSGAPAFGTPEYVRTAMIGGQMARRYGVPVPQQQRVRRQRARRAGRVRERVLAVGRDHGRRQLPDARRRMDGGRPARQPRARCCSTPTCCTW